MYMYVCIYVYIYIYIYTRTYIARTLGRDSREARQGPEGIVYMYIYI